ncbi:hypothetical protein STAFG_1401 [Streptomyces afghaniensis 772]|uniref:Uncharacterized protein n=1 Tax=Streptomyces afghaniensis 772 TaxID=1283301 RepID=S4MPR7_9ACTN|nr:hypothetical protein STAFG_1401 [Streptomyces afghaniensis 772]
MNGGVVPDLWIERKSHKRAPELGHMVEIRGLLQII